jgi:hypothetical protein
METILSAPIAALSDYVPWYAWVLLLVIIVLLIVKKMQSS